MTSLFAALALSLAAAAPAKNTGPRPNAGHPTLAPPDDATEQINFEYKARVYGICVRGADCKTGELWLDEATGTEARWVLPVSVPLEKVEKHYKEKLAAAGFRVIGTRFDEYKHERHLAASKKLSGGKVRGIELILRKTRAAANITPLHVIEYWEGVGRDMNDNKP